MNEFVEVKTTELTGKALDWAAAVASSTELVKHQGNDLRIEISTGLSTNWAPSKNWSQGGSLLEKYIWALPYRAISRSHLGKFESCTPARFPFNGETPLEAACRAIVAAEFGDYVMVPADIVVVK